MTTQALMISAALLLLIPTMASGQAPDTASPRLDQFSVQAGAGPLLRSDGYTLSAAFGFSPLSRLDLIVSVERSQLPFTRDTFSNRYSVTRGGTLMSIGGEVRASLLPPHRVSPYGFAGIGGGVSRPTVNDEFPSAVKNELRLVYFGGGLRVPIGNGLTVFGDARAMLGLEGNDGIMGLWPVRAGLAWRF